MTTFPRSLMTNDLNDNHDNVEVSKWSFVIKVIKVHHA